MTNLTRRLIAGFCLLYIAILVDALRSGFPYHLYDHIFPRLLHEIAIYGLVGAMLLTIASLLILLGYALIGVLITGKSPEDLPVIRFFH